MNNLIIFPLLIPLLAAILTVLIKCYRREIAIGATAIASIISFTLAYFSDQQMYVINFGNWTPPFGIQFAGDFLGLALSGVSLILTSLILLYGLHTNKEDDRNVPYILFLLVGVNGSFLTADIFNLFVQFEVMLLASFVLMAIGNQSKHFKASIQYVVINIVGSWLFLVAIAMTYSLYGTLSFAHLSVRVQEYGMTRHAIIIAILYLLVFALKSALILFMWLPKSYAVLSTETSAIFSALLTKVGVYAIIRFFTVIFSIHAEATHQLIMIASIITMIIGCIGVLAYRDIKYMICYQIIISIGIIIFGLATDTQIGLSGSILYLMNDMLIKGLLFLISGLIISELHINTISGNYGLLKKYPILAALCFLITLTIGGVPPFGGFAGKLMIIRAGLQDGAYSGTILLIISSLIAMYALLRMFISVFYGTPVEKKKIHIHTHQYWAMVILMLLSVGISIFAQPLLEMSHHLNVSDYTDILLQGGNH